MEPNRKLTVKPFAALTVEELYEILRLRVNVFVVEQHCPYPEIDGQDADALHVWLEEDGEIVAYLRVLTHGVPGEAWLGRVISVRRRAGLGTQLLKEGIRLAEEHFGAQTVRVEAQTYAKPFYEGVGFRQTSDEFLEDGIPHIEMALTC